MKRRGERSTVIVNEIERRIYVVLLRRAQVQMTMDNRYCLTLRVPTDKNQGESGNTKWC